MSKATGDFFVDKVSPLLRMLTSNVERERLTALNALLNVLAGAGLDFHAVADRVANPGFSDAEVNEICEKLKHKIWAEADAYVQQIEQQRATVPVTPKSLFGGGGVSNYGFDDSDRVAGDQVYNGYRWLDIAAHCAANLNRIPAKHHGFIADMASKLAGYRTVSGAQAKYLGNLFNQYLSGRI